MCFKKGIFGIIAMIALAVVVAACGHDRSEWDEACHDHSGVSAPASTAAGVSADGARRGKSGAIHGDALSISPNEPRPAPRPARTLPSNRIHINPVGPLSQVFNDSNYRQYLYAELLGISPIRTLRDAYRTNRPIVKITSTDIFTVDSLSHSMPFLVPQGRDLLVAIAKAFRDSLKSRGAGGYRPIVTSLLRSPHSVKRLRRVNRNATDSSTHQFGTTFDISWTRFDCFDSTRTLSHEDLKNLLAEVLYDKRSEGRCLVKYERHTACFHITATK